MVLFPSLPCGGTRSSWKSALRVTLCVVGDVSFIAGNAAGIGRPPFSFEPVGARVRAPVLADLPALLPYSGDYEIWGGLVLDFLEPQARSIFAEFYDQEHVALGVSG